MAKWSIAIVSLILIVLGDYNFKDLSDFFNYLGNSIFPSHPNIGVWFMISLYFYAIFFEEINNFLITNSKRVRIKKNF